MADLTSFYGIRESTDRLLSSEQNSQINKPTATADSGKIEPLNASFGGEIATMAKPPLRVLPGDGKESLRSGLSQRLIR
jgi:hypothetical protein